MSGGGFGWLWMGGGGDPYQYGLKNEDFQWFSSGVSYMPGGCFYSRCRQNVKLQSCLLQCQDISTSVRHQVTWRGFYFFAVLRISSSDKILGFFEDFGDFKDFWDFEIFFETLKIFEIFLEIFKIYFEFFSNKLTKFFFSYLPLGFPPLLARFSGFSRFFCVIFLKICAVWGFISIFIFRFCWFFHHFIA